MKNTKIITRFAPSPTGLLHIGGARTALICYLFAKKNDGLFYVRTEDTDKSRHIEEMVKNHVLLLNWLGIKADQSILNNFLFRQTNRLKIYKKYLDLLFKKNLCYKCYCNKEILEEAKKKSKSLNFIYPGYCRNKKNNIIDEKEKYVIRIKSKSNTIYRFEDKIRGNVEFNSNDCGDFIIFKSDGFPTYNYAVVIDDIDMKITHVIRGEEHLTNTSKQLLLYDLLKHKPPFFSHISLILNENKKKLSKRDVSIIQFIDNYKKMGFLPDAIVNFMGLLGNKPMKTQEFFTLKELINTFSFSHMSKAPAIFDYQKLLWFNKHYIDKLNDDEYLKYIFQYIDKNKYLKTFSYKDLCLIILSFRKEIDVAFQLIDKLNFFVNPVLNIKSKNDLKNYDWKKIILWLNNYLKNNIINNINDANNMISYVKQNTGLSGKNLFMPLRIIISKSSTGFELNKIIYLYRKSLKNKIND